MMEGTRSPAEVDPYPNVHGVLLSDQIKLYVDACGLIGSFKEENLKAASYDFTLGDKYIRGGKEYLLDDSNPNLEIKPHEAVVVSTKETLNMPRFLAGSWNLRITRVFQGLVWVGGLGIDPGWQGELWCPLYNLSKNTVVLRRGETFASIEFMKTTNYNPGISKAYTYQRGRPDHPGSGLEELRDEVQNFPSRLEFYQSITFTVISVLVAAIAIVALLPFSVRSTQVPSLDLAIAALGLGVSAFFLSLVSLIVSIKGKKIKTS